MPQHQQEEDIITEFHSECVQCQVSRHRTTEPLSLPDSPATAASEAHLTPHHAKARGEQRTEQRGGSVSARPLTSGGPQANPILAEPQPACLSEGDITEKQGGYAKVCKPQTVCEALWVAPVSALVLPEGNS